MSVDMPNPRSVFLPKVPATINDTNLRKYLDDLVSAIQLHFSRQFDNTYSIVSTGTSGTFLDSGGNTITIDSGVITKLS